MAEDGPTDPRREGIYRVIRLIALADVVIGLALVFFEEPVLGTANYRYAGLGLAVIGIVVFAFFTRLAALAARR